MIHRYTLLACLGVWSFAQIPGLADEMTTAFSRSHGFSIPVPAPNAAGNSFVATRLFVSKDRGTNWRIASTHHSQIRQIAVEAQDDGDYWFAIRHLTSQGISYPKNPLEPQLHVLVDGTPPQLEIAARQPTAENLLVSVDSYDLALLPGSLEIRVLSADPSAKWQSVRVDPQNLVMENGRLKATVSVPWTSPFDLRIRAAIWDKVGHKSVAETNLSRQARAPERLDLTRTTPLQNPLLPTPPESQQVMQAAAQTDAPSKEPGVLFPEQPQTALQAEVVPPPASSPAPAIPTPPALVPEQPSPVQTVGRWKGRLDPSPQIAATPAQDDAFPAATFAIPEELPAVNEPAEQAGPAETDLSFIERLVEKQPENVRIRKAFAELLTDQQDYYRAELQWRWVLKLSPQNVEARKQLAACLLAQNRPLEAQQVLDQVPASP